LILLGLIVPWSDRWLRGHVTQRQRMTLQAELIDLANLQQSRIRRAMRKMATAATFGFYGQMLEDKRPLFLAVALVADLVLLGAGAQLSGAGSAVRVMAIVAFDKPLIHTVAERAIELGASFGVALITELRLLCYQQRLFLPRLMRRVATGATDVGSSVGRTEEIALLVLGRVALKTSP